MWSQEEIDCVAAPLSLNKERVMDLFYKFGGIPCNGSSADARGSSDSAVASYLVNLAMALDESSQSR